MTSNTTTGDRPRSQTEQEAPAEVYEWTVLKRLPDRVAVGVAVEHGSVLWRQVGIIGSRYEGGLYDETESAVAIGEIAGPGEYLCYRERRCWRLVVVAPSVDALRAMQAAEQGDALAEKMMGQ